MKRLFAIPLLVTPLLSLAEPTNLDVNKQALIKYHDSGRYQAEIKSTLTQAQNYLAMRLKLGHLKGKPAIVLDIDETSLSNYPDLVSMSFGGTDDQVDAAENKGQDPVIQPTLNLFNFAKSNGVTVFFVTGRKDTAEQPTVSNLQTVGYANWDKLYMRTPDVYNVTAEAYKSAIRKQITQQGYDIIETVGDQKSDLMGGFADKGFKVPNPYYFIA